MSSPLADRMRPATLDDMVGQHHLVDEGKALRRIIESGNVPNLIFYGPSGVGKTTLARIIAGRTNRSLHILNGTTASTQDIRAVIDEIGTFSALDGILLYLDEIQYFNKRQQQSLLEHIENGNITLIASTTENPYFYIYNAILSRSTVFEFKPVDAADIAAAVRRAVSFLSKEQGRELKIEDAAVEQISQSCGGDVRKSLNAVELSAACVAADEQPVITADIAEQLAQRSAMRYDRDGDAHYDIFSAFQKSMRGSDPNAALHYLSRQLEAGDLPGACRRLLVTACEDVGLAYPQIIPIVKACVDSAFQLGLPEARIPLADAVIMVATAPKSNSGICAVDAALADVRAGHSGPIPDSLRDGHYSGAQKMGHAKGYVYPHPYPNHYYEQQYLPDEIKNAEYYRFGDNKNEQAFKAYWDAVKRGKKE